MGSPVNPLKHPNLEIPPFPKGVVWPHSHELRLTIRWVLEAAARAVSPPKLDGENNELKCEEVARVIRGPLYEKLTKEL